jgi:ABC-type nitrate/sulfonate/bicarbonate transport system ATPase subunit
MDEPFGALDDLTRKSMQMLLLDIWAKTRKTILMVTHSISEACFMSESFESSRSLWTGHGNGS